MMPFSDLELKNKLLYGLIFVFLVSLAYSEALKNISTYLLIGFFLFQTLSRSLKPKLDLINIAILMHMCVVLIGIWLGINSKESLSQFMDVIHIGLIFLFFREAKLQFLSFEKIIQLIFYGFIFAILMGFYSYFEGGGRLELQSVGSVNRTSVYLMFIFVTSACLFENFKGKLNRILFLATFSLSLIGIVVAASRMAIYALPVIILFALFVSNNNSKKLYLTILFISFIFVLFLYLFFPESQVVSRLSIGLYDVPRLQIWNVSIQAWLQNNIFFGVGVGNSIQFDVFDYFHNASLTRHIDNAHNVYLDMLLERGIFGLFSFLLFIFAIFFNNSVGDSSKFFLKVICFSLLFMGIANITFRYEFALLFVTLIGSYLNKSIKK